ncbi:MAG: CPXCG motif-containing cysteine-rich protein [Oryzomonas sp.]|jgi:transcription elongation factor Elf1
MPKHHPPKEEPLETRKKVFACPHCGERVSVVLDLSVGYQRYIEDCEVCCNPIEITYEAEEGVIVAFRAGIP